jgi:hypothetical protein
MDAETDTHKNEIADNVKRTVERVALRKARKLVDNLEAEETAKYRLEKRALIIAVVVGTVAVVWFVSSLIASDEKYERGQALQLPDKVVVPRKD